MNRPSDGANRRHSVIDTSVQTQQLHLQDSSSVSDGSRQDPQPPTKAPSPLRQSIEPPASQDGVSASVEASLSPDLPPPRRQRFSMLKYRHASDPQISKTAKDQETLRLPPMPAAPSIITTAPTDSFGDPQKRKSTLTLPRRSRPELPRTLSTQRSQKSLSDRMSESGQRNGDSVASNQSESRIASDETEKVKRLNAPPPYGDESNSSLALPVSRLSESSRSDGSLGDQALYASTTTTHTVSTTTTFFRLPRRKKKDKGPLFPLPAKTPPLIPTPTATLTPRASTSGRPSESSRRQSPNRTPPTTALRRALPASSEEHGLPSTFPSPTRALESARRDSTASAPTGRTSPTHAMPVDRRSRSSTKNSLFQNVEDERAPTPPLPHSGRTSTSTTGRASLGGVFNLSRLRQNSEPQQQLRRGTDHPPLPGTPISTGSKSQSFSIERASPIVVPERKEGETPAKYLIRLEETVSRHIVATILSQKNDEFFKNVLRSYMRGFKFFGEPLDMAVRKMLMEVELPKETQQIDRVLQAFANRYHECNPGVYASPDEAYFIAFSILILHTDVFNKNNKNKMQKQDYTKNARGQGVAEEILECFYDNISYTPFIHVDDDIDLSGERRAARKLKKNPFSKPSTDSSGRPSREPVDPYTIILDDKLDSLRPPIKEVMNLEDHFNYFGTAHSYNFMDLSKSFFKFGVLQILSSRSRPEAFTSPQTMANPSEAHVGVVDMKVTKVGILWRKDMKKKKARSPWQEWGTILTGTSLYFFRNSSWVKSLMHQHDNHHKHAPAGSPCVFKPPLEQFKPDVLLPTQDAVALVDTTYKKHKNALLFVRHGGIEETFLADNEAEMNDWLAKLNYAAAFRTAGVNMRDLVATSTQIPTSPTIQLGTAIRPAANADNPANEATPQNDHSNIDLAYRVQIARRQILSQRIAEAEEKLSEASRQLEAQLRNARHLQILAPIQNRTREQIVLAAGGMAAKIKWMRVDIWRTRCHRDILAKDLEDDIRLGDGPLRNDQNKDSPLPAPSLNTQVSRPLESQEEPTTPSRRLRRPSAPERPVTQPSPAKTFNMDDVFSSMQQPSSPVRRMESNHQPKGSWELPPLSFIPTKTSMKSGSSTTSSLPTRHPLVPQPSSRSVSENTRSSEAGDLATKLATPTPSVDNNEQQILREAGLLEPESPSTSKGKRPESPNGDKSQSHDMIKTPEPEFNESRSKVRRSLHRTLRESSHVPSHHRSKKGKDSAGSTTATEESNSQLDKEGLARGTGSFTVHGKKASVINFGSDWHGMSPEERLNFRKQAQHDGSKLAVPSAIEDEDASLRSASNPGGRPVSAVSASTTTTKSGPFEEALEEPVEASETSERKNSEIPQITQVD